MVLRASAFLSASSAPCRGSARERSGVSDGGSAASGTGFIKGAQHAAASRVRHRGTKRAGVRGKLTTGTTRTRQLDHSSNPHRRESNHTKSIAGLRTLVRTLHSAFPAHSHRHVSTLLCTTAPVATLRLLQHRNGTFDTAPALRERTEMCKRPGPAGGARAELAYCRRLVQAGSPNAPALQLPLHGRQESRANSFLVSTNAGPHACAKGRACPSKPPIRAAAAARLHASGAGSNSARNGHGASWHVDAARARMVVPGTDCAAAQRLPLRTFAQDYKLPRQALHDRTRWRRLDSEQQAVCGRSCRPARRRRRAYAAGESSTGLEPEGSPTEA